VDAHHIRCVPSGRRGVRGLDAAGEGEKCVAVGVDHTAVLCSCCRGRSFVGREDRGSDVSIIHHCYLNAFV